MPAYPFNADEVFIIAEQIERNGAAFYRAAANNNPTSRDFLMGLAGMEEQHLATFQLMHRVYSESGAQAGMFDPEGEAAAFLSVMAGGHVFDTRKDPRELLHGTEPLEEIIRIAIGLEKDSIVYYMGMKEFVTTPSSREQVEAIIREEMRHIALLSNQLSGS
ncbi:MAG: ferritin family protein [Chitinispirillaceae bacterium]|nr:ferritin family protein [Chitinispirillaceae bacterium]